MENLDIFLLFFVAVLLTVSVLGLVFVFTRDKKLIPWNRSPFQKLKMLLHQKVHLIKSWEEITYHELFPFDRRITVKLAPGTKIMPNSIICIGTQDNYDKFMICGPIYSWSPDTYTLDILYLGQNDSKKGITITYNS